MDARRFSLETGEFVVADRDAGASLAAAYAATRRLSRDLAAPLSDADCTVQSMPDASPVKWHLAHTTWFFETFVLRDHVANHRLFDDRWQFLFNSYYETEGARHPRHLRGLLTRPTLAQVLDYRDQVDAAMLAAIGSFDRERQALVTLGIHHEQQHQELILTDILHLFSLNPVGPAYMSAVPDVSSRTGPGTALRWVEGRTGCVSTGHQGGPDFAFDCESPAHDVLLGRHKLASRPVSNREWQAFIADGGYDDHRLWLADGWTWRRENDIIAPAYWRRDDGGEWHSFGLAGWQPLDPEAPACHVSLFEADAYAGWAGARLPTEAEWEDAGRDHDRLGGNQLDAVGAVRPMASKANWGVQALFGDVWEWTASAYRAYPGFRAARGAIGEYNGKFMSGQSVLKGGSCATPRGHVRATYRNFFYPHQRWQFCGVRLARDV